MSSAVAMEHSPRGYGIVGWLPPALLPCVAWMVSSGMQAWVCMWALAIAIYAGLKWLSWWRTRGTVEHTAGRSMGYLLGWPGMDAEAFLRADAPVARPAGREWIAALGKTTLGAVLFWGAARVGPGPALVRGWAGMVGLILLLHFGSFHVVALVWRRMGVDARPIMDAPLRSTALSEFWGKRWNLGFRQLSYDFIFRPLERVWDARGAMWAVFLASGLIHELVISVPARGGYGLPTAYFLAQGAGVALERSRAGRRLGLGRGMRGWLWMAVCTAGPAFWLFHPPFVLRVIIPFMRAMRAL